jgi:hypothetical protein
VIQLVGRYAVSLHLFLVAALVVVIARVQRLTEVAQEMQ